MSKFYKEYWVIAKLSGRSIILINNWHKMRSEEWHLISFFRKWRNGSNDYYFAFIGFQLRMMNNINVNNKYT